MSDKGTYLDPTGQNNNENDVGNEPDLKSAIAFLTNISGKYFGSLNGNVGAIYKTSADRPIIYVDGIKLSSGLKGRTLYFSEPDQVGIK
jgi:hypothetical protein